MTNTSTTRWETMKTEESRQVEEVLRDAGFTRSDAYRYNSASIRVRVVDPRFEGLSLEGRDALVEPHLKRLPELIQADIMTLFTFAPSEIESGSMAFRQYLLNSEFEDPSPSEL